MGRPAVRRMNDVAGPYRSFARQYGVKRFIALRI
jgi:hypothetical protein